MAIQASFPAIRPSLNLDFANSKVLDPRITFSRASAATYYDGKTVAKAEENLLTYSQQFDNVAWSFTNTTVTPNAVIAPNGELTADKLIESSTNAGHYLSQSFTPQSSASYVASAYIKKAERSFAAVQCNFGGVNTFAVVNLTTGVFGTPTGSGTFNAVDAGNGWWRCSITVTTTSAALGYFIVYSALDSATVSYAGDGISGIYIWGAQLEQRSSVTAYTPTTSQPITNYIPVLQTAAAGVPRIDHDPVTGECKGLLIEEQRANLLSYSSDFDNAAWYKINGSIQSNAVVAPDGTLTADKFVPSTTNTQHYFDMPGVYTAQNTTGTFSLYVKPAGLTSFSVSAAGGSDYRADFNLATGTVSYSAGGTATITSVGNGWFRCTLTAAPTAYNFTPYIFAGAFTGFAGDGYSGIYIWGAQLEAGAFPTSYIKTEASQVTRAADSASMTGSNFSSWYRQDEGSLYAEGRSFNTVPTVPVPSLAAIVDSAISARSAFIYLEGNVFGGSGSTINSGSASSAVNNKAIIAYVSGASAALSANGLAAVTGTTSTNLETMAKLLIGEWASNPGKLNGHIKRITYYPKRLSNSELQALTA